MSSDKPLRIVLLRHGETVYNVEKRLQSGKDSLTEKGKEQIRNLGEELGKFDFDEIICSDEKRAVQSAEIISSLLKKGFTRLPLIREKGSGEFSDMLVSEVDWSLVEGSFMEKKIPGGESVNDVVARASEFLNVLEGYGGGKTVLVVSHGTFLRVLFCLMFKKDVQDFLLNYEFPNSSYMVVSRSASGWALEKSPVVRR
jgi:broad specificity phosphatase PhoE